MAGFVRVQPWHDTAAGWLAADPILRLGEIGVESDTGKTKRGDGTSVWSALPYTLGETAADTAVADTVTNGPETQAALDARYKQPVSDRLDMVTAMHANAFPPIGVPPTISTAGPGGATPVPTPTSYPYDTALVTKIGCLPEFVTQYSTNYFQNAVNGTWTPPTWAVEFVTDAADLTMGFRTRSTSCGFWITVDGRAVSRELVLPDPSKIAAGSKSYLRLQFASAVRRTIRIYMYLADFGGMDVTTGAYLAASATPPTISAVFLGDSWVEGTTQSPVPYTIPNIAARTLGWNGYLCGQGGTGFVATGGGGGKEKYGSTNRLSDVYAVAPTYLVVFASGNDDSLAGVQSEAAALFAAVATNLPATKVLVVGPNPYPYTAARKATAASVKAAADAAPNVLAYIDTTTWITGTGKLTDRRGDGNADYMIGADAVHPSRLGAHYWGRRTAGELLVELMASGLAY